MASSYTYNTADVVMYIDGTEVSQLQTITMPVLHFDTITGNNNIYATGGHASTTLQMRDAIFDRSGLEQLLGSKVLPQGITGLSYTPPPEIDNESMIDRLPKW